MSVCVHRGWTFWNGWDHFFGTPASERVQSPINAVQYMSIHGGGHFVAVLFAENGAAVVAPGGAVVAPHLAPLAPVGDSPGKANDAPGIPPAPVKRKAVASGLTAAVVGQKLGFGPQKRQSILKTFFAWIIWNVARGVHLADHV
eukprot:gene16565-2877_t